MDPFSAVVSFLVVCHFLAVLANGEGHTARVAHLEAAGVEPATSGGPARQYLANAWRDGWLKAAEKRAARRAAAAVAAAGAAEESAWARLRKRMAARVDQAADRFGSRWHRPEPTPPAAGDPAPAQEPKPKAPPALGHSITSPGPIRVTPATVAQPATPTGQPVPQQLQGGTPAPPANPHPATPVPPAAPPVTQKPIQVAAPAVVGERAIPAARVLAAVGATAPIRVTAAVTGPAATTERPAAGITPAQQSRGDSQMTNAVARPVAATGVLSGAAAARQIARQMEDAAAAYQNAMASIRSNINALGEQTLAVVQMAGHSYVVAALQGAAESAATAQVHARSVGQEVAGALYRVATAYDRLQS